MWTRLKNCILRWAAKQSARKLSVWLPARLDDLRAEFADDDSVAHAVDFLAHAVDPKVRTPQMTVHLQRLCQALEDRAKATPGQLDDGAVLLVRGLLNTPPADPKKGWA